jgi:hypothetical protein
MLVPLPPLQAAVLVSWGYMAGLGQFGVDFAMKCDGIADVMVV